MSLVKKIIVNPRGTLRLGQAALDTFWTSSRVVRNVHNQNRSPVDPKVMGMIQQWAKRLCKTLKIEVEVEGERMNQAGIFIGNHMSYVDIPVLKSLKATSFVAKDEIRDWPFFGKAGEAFGAIYIDRSSQDSRAATAEALKKAIQEDGREIVVFPGGTTSLYEKDWRPGAFKLAQEIGCPVQFFTIAYNPGPVVAFEVDSMIEHCFRMLREKRIKAKVHFAEPVVIENWEEAFPRWEKWNKELIKKELQQQN